MLTNRMVNGLLERQVLQTDISDWEGTVTNICSAQRYSSIRHQCRDIEGPGRKV